VLARIAPIQRPASALPTAVRAVEGEVADLRHLSSVDREAGALPLLERGGVARERRSSSEAGV
jgi:hypothetical protein